ncbi:MAG: Txe/YoeB family addiction module toxin [Bacteroidota bacterium]
MEIIFFPDALKDLDYWKQTGQTQILSRIRELTESIIESPFSGIGKPEPLKHQHSGRWSRRINLEHRYIYRVSGNILEVLSLRGHYEK